MRTSGISADELTCSDPGCEIREKMEDLSGTLESPPEDASSNLIDTFFNTYQFLVNSDSYIHGPKIMLPALFDLIVSGHYAGAVQDENWSYCGGRGNEEPALYSPFLKAHANPKETVCPRCSGKHDELYIVHSNKPESDNIGMDAESANILLLSKIADIVSDGVGIYDSKDRQGDVDIVITTEELTILCELKSSPFMPIPLEIMWSDTALSSPPTNHDRVNSNPNLASAPLSLYLPYSDLRIPVGTTENNGWPFPALSEYFSEGENVRTYLDAWKEIYDGYVNDVGKWSDSDARRWMYAGCGKDVSDSKQKPGLDRTDDIKKGTFQAVKYTTTYKDKCSGNHIRSALVSNFFPTRMYERYYEDIEDLVLIKPSHSLGEGSNDRTSFQRNNVYNLFDSVLCLTDSVHNDDDIQSIAGHDELLETLRDQ